MLTRHAWPETKWRVAGAVPAGLATGTNAETLRRSGDGGQWTVDRVRFNRTICLRFRHRHRSEGRSLLAGDHPSTRLWTIGNQLSQRSRRGRLLVRRKGCEILPYSGDGSRRMRLFTASQECEDLLLMSPLHEIRQRSAGECFLPGGKRHRIRVAPNLLTC